MDDILLEAKNICYTYEGENTPALNQLSLQIPKGKKIACMGSNGSGKSTFFLCCNGIHKPDSGTICYDGRPLDYSRKGLLELRSKVGIVFQDPDNQLFSASVFQEISFGLLGMGIPENEARKRVDEIMELLGITPFAHKPVHVLSGGQKKIVAIADILVMKPQLIIFDEPAASLDPLHTSLVREIINQAATQGITILMATHDVDYAYEWADQILLFHEGKILSTGTPQEIFSNEEMLQTANLKPPMIISILKHPEILERYRKELRL